MNEKIPADVGTPEFVKRISEALNEAHTAETPENIADKNSVDVNVSEVRDKRDKILGKIDTEKEALNKVRQKLKLPPTDRSNALNDL